MDKRDRQIKMEEQSVKLGISRYYNERLPYTLGDPKSRQEALSMPGRRLIAHALPNLTQEIDIWKVDAKSGKPMHNATLTHILDELDSEVCALITLKAIVNSFVTGANLQKIAKEIVPPLMAEINKQRLLADKPHLEYILDEEFSKEKKNHKVMRLLKLQTDWHGTQCIYINPSVRQMLSDLLLARAFKTTGLFTFEVQWDNSVKASVDKKLRPTEEVLAWLASDHARCSLLNPLTLPMIVPPEPWTGLYNGGYLTEKLRKPLIRGKAVTPKYLKDIQGGDMSLVFEAVNAIQETSWRINKAVHAVIEKAWKTGSSAGNLATLDIEPLPAKPYDIASNEEALAEWKAAAYAVHRSNEQQVPKRLALSQKLYTSSQLLDEPEIFFPHHTDWRGRIYPSVGGNLHPQSDDTGKALLEFAKGKKLGKSGSYWLAVHLANKYGEDKISFADRVAWTHANSDEIVELVTDPLDFQNLWTQADKPYQFLAACFEWAGYMTEGEDYESHIPIAMDGSNNGAQHLSAVSLDETASVNLKPAEKPQDVYQDVADLALRKIHKDAINGVKWAYEWDKLGRKAVNRKMAKKPVMITCYGAQLDSITEAIRDVMREASRDGEPMCEPTDIRKMAKYLSRVIKPSIAGVLPGAVSTMGWMRKVASVVTKCEQPIYWETPVRFPIIQQNRKPEFKRVCSHFAGISSNTKVGSWATGKLDVKKQGAGIAPNFVHSLDASHLMMAVLLMINEGIDSFAMIHDSYGCHACDVDIMNKAIRESFLVIHEDEPLEAFEGLIAHLLPDDQIEKLPDLPEPGDLKLRKVLQSKYFFA